MKNFRWNGLEALAVLSSLLYTLLFSYGYILCWLFALIASGSFLILCYQRKIYAELALQVFYLAMAVYGYLNWGEALETKAPLPLETHAQIIGACIILILISAWLLGRYSDAKLPLLDSFTSVSSIAATFLMVNFYEENWLYFLVINAVSIFLYWKREMPLGALLFVLYTLLSINGYLVWTGWWS